MIHWDLITPAPNSRVISHCGGTLEDSLRLPCIHPSPPTSPPWPLKHHSPVPPQQSHENTRSSVIHFSLQAPFSLKLLLLSFTCLDLMESNAFPTPLDFPRLIWLRLPAVSISGSCGFCLHSEFWVYSPLWEGFFFFPCPSPSLQLSKLAFTVCAYACMTMSSLSSLMFLWAFSSAKGARGSSNIQLSESTSKADENKTAELKRAEKNWMPACLWVLPFKDPRPECVCVCVRVLTFCVRETVSGRAEHRSPDMMFDTWKTWKKKKSHIQRWAHTLSKYTGSGVECHKRVTWLRQEENKRKVASRDSTDSLTLPAVWSSTHIQPQLFIP